VHACALGLGFNVSDAWKMALGLARVSRIMSNSSCPRYRNSGLVCYFSCRYGAFETPKAEKGEMSVKDMHARANPNPRIMYHRRESILLSQRNNLLLLYLLQNRNMWPFQKPDAKPHGSEIYTASWDSPRPNLRSSKVITKALIHDPQPTIPCTIETYRITAPLGAQTCRSEHTRHTELS
jgi:hypothetical protein